MLLRPLGALEDWTPEDLTIATASLRSQMLRLRHHASLLVWLNGSDNPPPANVESAYLQVEAETHWPNPILSSAIGNADHRDRRKRREDDRALRLRCAELLVCGIALWRRVRLQHRNQSRAGDSFAGKPQEVSARSRSVAAVGRHGVFTMAAANSQT